MNKSYFIVLLGLAFAAYAAPPEDLVSIASVPLWNQYAANYTASIYSGYLTVNSEKALHYVFWESQSSPQNDPVILWMNGGPGCSSMLGMTYEHGVFVFPDGSTNTEWNIYSWNTNANIIYMESPACVGYSYCSNPEMNFNDETGAQDNLEAVISWFGKFPEFSNNSFYVMGESYAGVYVPWLSYLIDQHNSNNQSPFINLAGFAVGNAVTHPVYDSYSDLWFWSGHGLLSPAEQELVEEECNAEHIEEKNCEEYLEEYFLMLEDINIYDIYRYCWQGDSQYQPFLGGKFRNPPKPQGLQNEENEPDPGRPPCVDDVGGYYFFNNPQVKNALHIWPNASINNNHEWTMCVNFNYTSLPNASYWIYPHMISKGYKILVYSGDTDGAVPTDGTIKWIQALAAEIGMYIKRPMSQWTLPGVLPNNPQVAGYAISYSGLEFVTVKGVGHMVPQWQRPAAYKMIYSFLNGTPLV